jgi:hypothetical protein
MIVMIVSIRIAGNDILPLMAIFAAENLGPVNWAKFRSLCQLHVGSIHTIGLIVCILIAVLDVSTNQPTN